LCARSAANASPGRCGQITTESKVVMDHFESSTDDTLQVNFNFSFPHLKCDYASVDATNFMGTHDAGLAARVSKIRLDEKGRPVGRHEDSKKELQHTVDEKHDGPEVSALPVFPADSYRDH
jgi:hypothetical protein